MRLRRAKEVSRVSFNRDSVKATSNKDLACRNESTNVFIRRFYHKGKFALMSVSVGVFKPSEQKGTKVEGNI